MIRLTITLLFGIGVTMVLAGRDIERAEGSDQPMDEVAVMRLDPSPEALQEAGTFRDMAMAIPLEDTEEAMAAALRATEEGHPAPEDRPAPADKIVASAAPEATPAPEPVDHWYVTGSRVNLRSGPSTSTAVIGQVTYGAPAEVIEETPDGWFRIAVPGTGAEGYIYGKFLSPNEPL